MEPGQREVSQIEITLVGMAKQEQDIMTFELAWLLVRIGILLWALLFYRQMVHGDVV